MTTHRLIDGKIQRQDVEGGDWMPLSTTEANALLAGGPVLPAKTIVSADGHSITEHCPHCGTEIEPLSLPETFQRRVKPWMDACFGPEISADRIERNHRFLEEAIELVQANGCTRSEAHQLVDYVFGRPQGDINQEVGGVMVTLAALCLANGDDMHRAGEVELARIWTKVEQIRAKQAAKPKHSPLPGPSHG